MRGAASKLRESSQRTVAGRQGRPRVTGAITSLQSRCFYGARADSRSVTARPSELDASPRPRANIAPRWMGASVGAVSAARLREVLREAARAGVLPPQSLSAGPRRPAAGSPPPARTQARPRPGTPTPTARATRTRGCARATRISASSVGVAVSHLSSGMLASVAVSAESGGGECGEGCADPDVGRCASCESASVTVLLASGSAADVVPCPGVLSESR